MEKFEIDVALRKYFKEFQKILEKEKAKIFNERCVALRCASSTEKALCDFKLFFDIYLIPGFIFRGNEARVAIIIKVVEMLKNLEMDYPSPPGEIKHLFPSGNLSTPAKNQIKSLGALNVPRLLLLS